MKRIAILLTALFLATPLTAQYVSFYVQHPQQTWKYGTGTINDATVVLRPHGAFLQCDLYLLFSAKGLNFSSADSVEVQLNFPLPAGAAVTDLWLWVDQQIMRGLILDRWTASNIYEGIVKRRRDPAILTKTGSTSYSLRVYPLPGDATRRVMISYLIPMTWAPGLSSGVLPLNILKASRYGPPMFRVRYKPDSLYNAARINEIPGIQFQTVTDSASGAVLQAELPSTALNALGQLSVSMDRPSTDSVFLSVFRRGNEGFYQLGLTPSTIMDFVAPRKIAVVVDYDSLATNVRPPTFLASLRSELDLLCTAEDSLAVIFAGKQGLQRVNEGWLPGSSDGIEYLFSRIDEYRLSGTSSLKALLLDAGTFIREYGNRGTILLVSASAEYTDPLKANPVLAEIRQGLPADATVNIVSFARPWYKYVYMNNRSYYNNDYLFLNLSDMTKGIFVAATSYTVEFAPLLKGVLPYLRGTIEALDVHTSVADGLATARYRVSDQSLALDASYIQVGRFYGDLPFEVEVGILRGGVPEVKRFVIPDSPRRTGDSTLAQAWASAHIAFLESQPSTPSLTQQIVSLSVRERVLSKFTAFLALEPNDTLPACKTCRDESGGTTAVQDPKAVVLTQDSLLAVYPNPFNASTVISVRLPSGVKPDEVSLRIYNILGQLVRTFDTAGLDMAAPTRVTWDARNDHGAAQSSGTYLLVLQSPKGNMVKRLLLVK